MPYFLICPIYVFLVLCLLALAALSRATVKYREYSSPLALGAIGTFPGLLLGNALFWVLFLFFAFLLKKTNLELDGDVAKTTAAVGLLGVFVAGLAVANVAGCGAGFLLGFRLGGKMSRPSYPLPKERFPK